MCSRLLAAAVCVILLMPARGLSQQSLGINWDVPNRQNVAAEELHSFADAGFSYLQINKPLEPETWDLAQQLDFSIYAMLPVHFPIASDLTMDSLRHREIQQVFSHYKKQPAVKAIGLFANGHWSGMDFRGAATRYSQQFSADSTIAFYHQTAQIPEHGTGTLFDFTLLSRGEWPAQYANSLQAFLYRPGRDSTQSLGPLKSLLEQTKNTNTVLFIDSSWLKQISRENTQIRPILHLYATSSSPAFPLPKRASRADTYNNVVILLLLLAWILLAVTYNYNPVYRRSLIRYYSGHNFYVNDVMERHIRSMFAGTSLLLQHAIAGGAVFYCAGLTLFSSLGLQALQYHYSAFLIFGSTPLGLFFTGISMTLVIEFVLVFWLRMATFKTTHLSQIINLYPWALQFNLVLATIILGLFLSGASAWIIYPPVILFVILFLGSFVIPVFDLAHHISLNKKLYFVATLGIYGLMIAGFLSWTLLSARFRNVVDLVANLP